MKLIDGMGQLGTLLKNRVCGEKNNDDAIVYHTWNIDDKSMDAQKKEHAKFCNFVKQNKHEKIIFISTSSQNESFYVKYKQLSESFLIQNCKNCLVLRFPTLIGKGVFEDFKSNKKKPYGVMNIMTLDRACDIVIEHLNYNGLLKILSFDGHEVDAKIVYNLVRV
tara:strand:+ start:20532 stop:21026 length:495 start_codon:yes stop_codon:yes gene_type:complete